MKKETEELIAKLSDLGSYIYKISQINEKIKKIKDLKTKECGNCDHHMKSSLCPIEKAEKPSISHFACKKFKRSFWVQDLIDKLTLDASNERGCLSDE